MEKVAVARCNSYDEAIIYDQLIKLLEPFNGIKSFIKPGQRVLLKANLLMGKPPEAAVTSHPVLVKAVAKLVKEAGGEVIIGDSPGGPFTTARLKKIYQKTGLTRVAEESGAQLNYNVAEQKLSFPDGKLQKSFMVAKYITEADFIINIPKLKTHGMTMFTGAVKNIFGAIPGMIKAEYHLKTPNVALFSQMLLELALFINPGLNIMDAIVGMDGEGPSGGNPKDFGYLLLSPSPLALDLAAVYLLGIKPPEQAPLIKAAKEMGLPSALEQLEFFGDQLRPVAQVRVPVIEQASNLLDQKLPEPITRIAEYLLRPRPFFRLAKCTGCAECYRACPAGVIEMIEQKPQVDLAGCIRCFCCQELCQYRAVEIKRPLLGKLLFS